MNTQQNEQQTCCNCQEQQVENETYTLCVSCDKALETCPDCNRKSILNNKCLDKRCRAEFPDCYFDNPHEPLSIYNELIYPCKECGKIMSYNGLFVKQDKPYIELRCRNNHVKQFNLKFYEKTTT